MIKHETIHEPREVRKVYCDKCGADITDIDFIRIERSKIKMTYNKTSRTHTYKLIEQVTLSQEDFCSEACLPEDCLPETKKDEE